MIKTHDMPDAIPMAKTIEFLDNSIKKRVTKIIIEKHVEEFKAVITKEIEKEMESVSIEDIKQFHDDCTRSQKIEIYLKWVK